MKNAARNRIGRLSSRRHLVPRIFFAGLLLVCNWARAATIHVPADHATIAEAVAAAHSRTDSSTTILIAPGTYAESGIVLDLPNLTLAGSVALARGPDGFPLDSSSQTGVARVQVDLPAAAVMFQVRAAYVRITGLVLDGMLPPPAGPGQGGFLITIDGTFSTDGFMIDGNLIQGAATGIVSRMASGAIQGNRLTAMGSGSASFGGRPEDAKLVTFSGNLVIGNSNVGANFQGGNGSRNKMVFPAAGDGPGSLSVEVSGNEFRGNGAPGPGNANLGLSFLVNDDSRSDPTQAASIAAQVHDNSFIENGNWGLAVAQRIQPDVAEIGYQFEGTFERNRYCGNGFNPAIFDFRQVTTTLNPTLPQTHFRYARRSKYIIHAENDPLASIGYDLDHPATDPDPPGGSLLNTLIFDGTTVLPAPLMLKRPAAVIGCTSLRANGPDANPTDLFLGLASSALNPKYRDSASVKFAGGNVFKEIGTWATTPSAESLSSAGNLYTWIGLKNSDDQGTRFDLQAELYKNGMLLTQGLTRCIQGVTRNPDSAEEVTVAFDSFPTTAFSGSDVLALRVLTRIGTNADGSQCTGHGNATGLRLYFDSTNRSSGFDQNP